MKMLLHGIVFMAFFGQFVNSDMNADIHKSDFYTAGVVEFVSPPVTTASPREMIDENLSEYLRLIDEASNGDVDILVFPEATLNYMGLTSRKSLVEFAVELEESDIKKSTDFDNVCDYSDRSSILAKLSAKIKEKRMYVLVNLIEKINCKNHPEECSTDGYIVYNTNLVFDRNGCVISRYHKLNLYMEPLVNITKVPEVEFFFTDFGVTFGHFVCFDIMFKYPAHILVQYGVKHILYPTYWFSHMPFHTATQIQQSFAYGNNVVLLAAGGNSPMYGQGGSGIYIGKNGATGLIMPGETVTQLIISKVPKDIESFSVQVTENVVKRYSLTQMDEFFLDKFDLNEVHDLPESGKTEICENKICCKFSIDSEKLNIAEDKVGYTYKLAVYQGASHLKEEVPFIAGQIYCAIVSCLNDTKDSCGVRYRPSDNLVPSVNFKRVHIEANLEIDGTEEDYLIAPTSLDFHLLPLNAKRFSFEKRASYNVEGKQFWKYETETKDVNDILTFGIYGRIYNIDQILSTVPQNDNEEDVPVALGSSPRKVEL